jgi:RNA polymerase sigma-70 factor (ECF subfamily)
MSETDAESQPVDTANVFVLVRAFAASRQRLSRIARGIVKPHDIEDIVQETFLRTLEASFRAPIHHPRSFMETTARNLALNFATLRDNRPREALEDPDDAGSVLAAELPGPDDCVDSQARFLLFCRAVRRLPVQCQRAFLLKKVYAMRREEIARYLGITESTVQKHIAKGMVMVTEYMESMSAERQHDAALPPRAGAKR